MKILGIGVDIIQNKRIKKAIKNDLFIKRTFSKNEIKYSKNILNKTNFFAKRFAAKEALAKAIGTGFSKKLNFKDIEIINDKNGKPYYSQSKKIKTLINKKFRTKKFKLFLSISDEKDYSVAFSTIQN
mgnify:CR=1 FL=1|tara:strand:+ start:797 stop:1180 length:384 start_codon:yes stop_codon:yes gene_type:complete